jgi:hypothetical protein
MRLIEVSRLTGQRSFKWWLHSLGNMHRHHRLHVAGRDARRISQAVPWGTVTKAVWSLLIRLTDGWIWWTLLLLLLLGAGECTVTQTTEAGETGEVASLTSSQYFGEIALLTSESRKATVRTEKSANAHLRITRGSFQRGTRFA